MSFWPAFCQAYNKPLLIDWLIEDVQHIMKFNILHYVLLLSSIYYPLSSYFLSSRDSSNSFFLVCLYNMFSFLCISIYTVFFCFTFAVRSTWYASWPATLFSPGTRWHWLASTGNKFWFLVSNNFATNRYGNALFYFPAKHGKVSCREMILISCSPEEHL